MLPRTPPAMWGSKRLVPPSGVCICAVGLVQHGVHALGVQLVRGLDGAQQRPTSHTRRAWVGVYTCAGAGLRCVLMARSKASSKQGRGDSPGSKKKAG